MKEENEYIDGVYILSKTLRPSALIIKTYEEMMYLLDKLTSNFTDTKSRSTISQTYLKRNVS